MYNKIQKISAVAVISIMAVMLMNCAGSKPGKGFTDPIPSEMRELINKKYSEAVYAVGTANGPNEGIAERKATMQARAEIARQFKTQIDALQKSYEEAVNDKSLEEYKQTIEIFTSLEVSGSKVEKTMIKPEENGFAAKVLVVVSAEQLKAIIDEKMQAMTSFKASQAYKELEERVAREKASDQ